MRISGKGILNSIKNNYHKIIPFTPYQTPTSSYIIILLFWGVIGFGYGSYQAREDYILALASSFAGALHFQYYIGIPVILYSLGMYSLLGNEFGLATFLISSICVGCRFIEHYKQI